MLVEERGYLPRVQKSAFGLTPAAWAKGDAALNAGNLAAGVEWAEGGQW